MGTGGSLPPVSLGSDSSLPNDLDSVYIEYLEEESLSKRFTSSLFKEDPSAIEHGFEWPDNNFLVDLLANPEMLTKYKTPKDVLDHVIFPLFCADHSVVSYYHQLVLQFFEFVKHEFKEYSRKYKNRVESLEERKKEWLREITEAHFKQLPPSDRKLESVDAIFDFIKDGKIFTNDQTAKSAIPFILKHIEDPKSVFSAINLGFFTGDVTPILATLPFLADNPKMKMGHLKFTGCAEWMRALSLNSVAFTPMINQKTRMTQILNSSAKNVCIAANGRYVYISESTGSMSVFLRGRRIQKVQVSRKEIVFACSNGMIYVTDFEKDYIYRAYPLEKLSETGKVRIAWPFCSDGNCLYSMTKPGKKVRVMVIESPTSIRDVKSVDLLGFDKKVPILGDFDVKTALLYCSGSILTLFKEKPLGDSGFEIRLRHYSLLSGQHISDFQFKSSIPVNSVVHDTYNRCFYGLSVFEGSTQLLYFPFFGGVPHWVLQLDFGEIHSANHIVKKFESAKTGKDVFTAVVAFLEYYVSHSLGFSFESLTANQLYTTTFGNFLCPMSDEFFSVVLDMLESRKFKSNQQIEMVLLSLLQMNVSNFEFHEETTLTVSDRVLEMFEKLISYEKLPNDLLMMVTFALTNAHGVIFRTCWRKGQVLFVRVYEKLQPNSKLFIVKNLASRGRLVFCIPSDMCQKLFSSIFDRLLSDVPVSLVDAELIDCFQHYLMIDVTRQCSEFTGIFPIDRPDFRKTYEIYGKIVFEKALQSATKNKVFGRKMAFGFRTFLFMLRPVIKYSVMAQSVAPHLFDIYSKMKENISNIKLHDDEGLTCEYTVFFEVFFLYSLCLESIMKGGKELKKAKRFLGLGTDMNTAIPFHRIKKILKAVRTGTIDRRLLSETKCVPEQFLDFVEEAMSDESKCQELADKFVKLYDTVQQSVVKQLGKRLSLLEKKIERLLLILHVKKDECFDDIIDFLKTDRISDKLKEIAESVGSIRKNMRRVLQGCEDPVAFEEKFYLKARFLLFLNLRDKDTSVITRILMSSLSLDEIFYFIQEADNVKKHIARGYRGIEKLITLSADASIFFISYLLETKFYNQFFSMVHRDNNYTKEMMTLLEKMLPQSHVVCVFYLVFLMAFDKNDQFCDLLRAIKQQQLPTSFTVLALSALYAKRMEHDQLQDFEGIEDIQTILFENLKGLTCEDVPVLRLAVKNNMKIPVSLDDVLLLLESDDESQVHSIVQLLADMIDRTYEQLPIFEWSMKQIGLIAMGKQSCFGEFSGAIQLSICDDLIELIRRLMLHEDLHKIFIGILKQDDTCDPKYKDEEYLHAAFAVLSTSFDTFHTHYFMRDLGNNTTCYITRMLGNGVMEYYSLPYEPFAVRKETDFQHKFLPIAEVPFSVDLLPEQDLLIPYFADALKSHDVKLLEYYVLQSLKCFSDSQDFLNMFIDSQPALVIEKFSFVDFSQQFLNILEFLLKHPVFESSQSFYCLNIDESITITDTSVESTSGEHCLYSPLLNGTRDMRLKFHHIEGNVQIGVQSLSFFHYSTSIYKFNSSTKLVTHNCVTLGQLDNLTELRYRPTERQLLFNDSFSVNIHSGTFCFIFILEGKTKLEFEVEGHFGGSHEFSSSVPYQTFASEKGDDLFKYPQCLLERVPDSFSTCFMCDRKPIEFSHFKNEKLANSFECDILTPFKNHRTSGEIESFYVYQLLGSIQNEINTKILMKSVYSAPNLEYISEGFDLSYVQLIDFANNLMTLLEPLHLDGQLISFSFDMFQEESAEFASDCYRKILSFFNTEDVIELWFSVLKNKMNNIDFHFIDFRNPNVIVFSAPSIKNPKKVKIDHAKGFLLFKGGFSQHMPQIATVNGTIPLRCNIVHTVGSEVTVQSHPEFPNIDNCVICIPLYSRPNTSLLDSVVELSVTFKYFVLFLHKNSSVVSHEKYQFYKAELYKFFINSYNFENPFFYSYAQDIIDFLNEHVPLSPLDLTEDFVKYFNILSVYSKDNPQINDFLKAIQALWDERALLPLRSFFPDFVSECERESVQAQAHDAKFILPSNPFPCELRVSEDYSKVVLILKLIMLQEDVHEFPFHYLLNIWATNASRFPPFTFDVVDKRTVHLSFTMFEPSKFELISNKKEIEFTNIGDGKFQANLDLPDNLRLCVVNCDHVKLDQFLLEHRTQCSNDIIKFIKNWDSRDDRRIMKVFPEAVLRQEKLSLLFPPELFFKSKYTAPIYQLMIRATVVVASNWLFVHNALKIESRACAGLYSYISRDIRLDMFLKELTLNAGKQQVLVTVNRMIALENRNGTRPHFENSFIGQILRQYKDPAAFRSPWKVRFEGEKAEDAGGPGRELITEASEDIVSRNTGLFVEFGTDNLLIPVSSKMLENAPAMYHMVGVILGIIIRSCVVQNFAFPPFFWKFMCTGELTIEDIYNVDPAYREKIEALRVVNEEEFDERYPDKMFSEKDFSGNQTIMKEGLVSFSRISEYISMSNQFRLSLIRGNLEHIREGLFENLDLRTWPLYVTPDLLEFCVTGFPSISAKSLIRVIKFERVMKEPVKAMFLQIVEELSNEQRAKLLKFVTGRIRLPKVDDGQTLFSVGTLWGTLDKLPRSQTCTNQLYLSERYSSYEVAKKTLIIAIENGVTFEAL